MTRTARVLGGIVVAGLAGVTALACGSENSSFGDDTGGGQDGVTQPGSSGGFGPGGQTDPNTPGKECAAQEAQATLAKRPIDILFVIDNSGSMSGEIAEVEKQINENFANIINASGIDYRVIMLSRHGANSGQRVCVKAPLSGTTCSPVPEKPVETARFFHHSTVVSSYNSLCRIVDSFAKPDDLNLHPTGYGALLRPGSLKVIVEVTDDRVFTGQQNGCVKPYDDKNTVAGGAEAASAFEKDLFALPGAPFGTAQKRDYVFHSIIALAPFDANDTTKAHPPTAPITLSKCTPGSENPGTGYQALSRATGGLRYPSCGLDYTTIFKEVAKGVIDGARIACEFEVPPPPSGQTLDLATVVPTFTPAGGTPVDFQQVANAGACGPGKFYIQDNKIKLCPATCDTVQKDTSAQIKIKYGCAVKGAN